MTTLEEIEAQLTGPGGPFETVQERVLGEPALVFNQRPRSLTEILAASASYGEKEYIVCEDRRISFEEHVRTVASVAAALRDRYGVGKGDRVAILAANCPEWIVAYWASVSLGAIAVGLNGWWAGDEILYGVEDCDPKVLIGDRKRLDRIAGRALSTPVVEIESDFAALGNHDPTAELPQVVTDEDDPATILYTSGTTGRAKGAVNTHRGIIAFLRVSLFHGVRMLMWTAARGSGGAGPSAPVCMLVNSPLFHVSGLYTGAVIPLATGVKTVWPTGRYDPVQVMRIIEREGVTSWGPMGTMVHRMAQHPDRARYDQSTVRSIGSGGAPASDELLRRMAEMFPNARPSLGLGYGLTESTSGVTMIFGEELEKYPGSVGRPLPTVEIEIRDADGKSLPEGGEGEIYVRGPQVMKEYWRRPVDTKETILPGRWLRTGDFGRIREGRLYVESRKRDLILRGGENVYPAEIEHCLEARPDVAEAAVLGVDHPELGQEVKAVVVPAPGETLDPEALTSWVAERLAYFKVPAHWEIRREPLPRNAAGKVMKQVLLGEAGNPFVEE